MNMTELREAFAYFRDGNRDSFTTEEIVKALADPTPITEEGLRELGLDGDDVSGWYLGEQLILQAVDNLGGWVDFNGWSVLTKTMGQLRGLLLFVGE